MALGFLDEDPWLHEFECCETLCRDIMEQLIQRQSYPRSTDKYSQLSANIRYKLKQYNNEVSQLNQKLEATSSTGNITPAESERRTRQIELLHSKGIQMQKLFDEQVINKSLEERRSLIGVGTANLDIGPSTSYSVTDIREAQKRMLGQQNEGLENLSKVIRNQKNIANVISREVDLHNEILDDIGEQIDGTNSRLLEETRHIGVVDRKDNTCAYWVIIILLFLSIITVSVI